MSYEKIYTQNLGKRILFVCKKCNEKMRFLRYNRRVVLECTKCGVYFVIESKVRPVMTSSVVYWGNVNKRNIVESSKTNSS